MDDYQNKHTEPFFREGDEVEFEIAKGTNYCRWNYNTPHNVNTDGGASGVWAQGTIVHAKEIWYKPEDASKAEVNNKSWYYVKYEIDGFVGAGYAAFPKPGNPHYTRFQWKRSGYLRKKFTPNCTCGSEVTYGASASIHSFWCDIKTGANRN